MNTTTSAAGLPPTAGGGLRRLAAIVLGLALLAVACGTEDGPATLAAVDDTIAEVPATTTSTVEAVSEPVVATDGVDDQAVTDAWCAGAAALAASESNPLTMDVFGMSPADMEAQFTGNLAAIEALTGASPAEIADDAAYIDQVFTNFVRFGEDAGWDLTLLLSDPAFLGAFDLRRLESAINELDRFTSSTCGVDLNLVQADEVLADQSDGPMAEAAVRLLQLPADLITAEQLDCLDTELGALLPGVSPEELALDAASATAIEEAFRRCGVSV
ncbi:MAG: hypothetical protein AAF547_23190 [Actinomycetota bacterium]